MKEDVEMSKVRFLCIVAVVSMLTFPLQAGAESIGLNFCDSLQKVLENSLLEGVDLGEFQYFLDMFQPNTMDMNGKIYVDLRTIPISNVAGLTEEQARLVLKAWGFNVVDTFYTTHPTVPEGQVIRTDPGAGKKVMPGSNVRLRVSTGAGDETQPLDNVPAVEFNGVIEGNGILDIANEFGLIQVIGNDESFNNGVITHDEVYNAWTHNFTQFQTDMGSLLSSVLPGMIPGLQEIFLAYLTLGDGDYTIFSKPVPNQFDGYMNGGAIFPPTPSIGKGFIRMNQTTDGTNITGMSFNISLSDITGATSITAVKIGDPAFVWWTIDSLNGANSVSYTVTPEQLTMIDTTQIFPNGYWDNFYIIVKTEAYPDGEIGIQMSDIEPGAILAEGNGSFGIIAGLIALLDDMLRDVTREELGTEIGFDNPYLNRENYMGLEKLLPDSDADGDGACNRCEYERFEKNYCKELLAKCSGSKVITKAGVDTGSNSTKQGSFTFRLWHDIEAESTYLDVEITPAVTLSKITQIGIFDGMNNEAPLIYNFPGPFTTSPCKYTITQAELESMPVATNPHLIICSSNQPGITDRGEIGADLIQYCPELFSSPTKGLVKEGVIRYVTAVLDPSITPDYCEVLSGCQIALKNNKVVPPVPNISNGTAHIDMIQFLENSEYSIKITIEHNVANPISAGIYAGDTGLNGDLILDLGTVTSPIEKVLTPEEYQLISGQAAYILIKSSDYPDGELRAQLDCTADVRVVNASSDSQPLDICMNGSPVFALVSYPSATNYATPYSNKYELRVLPGTGESGTCENTPILASSLDIFGDSSYTLLATGWADSMTLVTLEDDNRAPTPNYAKIRFVNGVKEGYNVDVIINGWPPELTPLFSNIGALTTTSYYEIAAPDTLDITVTRAGIPDNIIASTTDAKFYPDGVYTIFLVGPVPLKNGYQLLITEDRPGEVPQEGEGTPEGTVEGVVEGTPEGTVEGVVEGTPEGTVEGVVEGTPEGIVEGVVEGTPEGTVEGEIGYHSADTDKNWAINLSELLRVIQFFNMGGYHCDPSNEEDGYAGGYDGDHSCTPHDSDYNEQDWTINLSELLRLIQFFNMGGYRPCPGIEDNYCAGQQQPL